MRRPTSTRGSRRIGPSGCSVCGLLSRRAQRQEHFHQRRYETEPSTGEGKAELLQKAQAYVQRRDRAARQDPNFDFAQALYQISIVLGSVSIVATSRRLLLLGTGLGVLATLLMLNGFLLLVELPFG